MDISTIVAQQVTAQASLTQHAIKASAESGQAIANLVEQVSQNAPTPSDGRGSIVDISA